MEGVELLALTLQVKELGEVGKVTCSSKWKKPGLKGTQSPTPETALCFLLLMHSGSCAVSYSAGIVRRHVNCFLATKHLP